MFKYIEPNYIFNVNNLLDISYNPNPWTEEEEPEETALVVYNKNDPLDSLFYILLWDLRNEVLSCKNTWEILDLFLNNNKYEQSPYSDDKKEFIVFVKNNTDILLTK